MTFLNPYKGNDNTIRIDIAISKSDYERLKSVFTNPSDLTTVYGLWLKRLNDHIRDCSYSFLDREQLITDILGVLNQESLRDDRRGATRMGSVCQISIHEHSTESRTPASKKSSKGGKDFNQQAG